MSKSLRMPDQVAGNSGAQEILRVWAVEDESQYFAIDPKIWSDPAAWGLLLVDIARHVARAIAQTSDQSEETVLARIRQGLGAEWDAQN
jgi:hypothetical protein